MVRGWNCGRRWNSVQACGCSIFTRSLLRRTFTYCKPLIVSTGTPPIELNRLDFKNWSPTPSLVQGLLLKHLMEAAENVDAIIVLDQVDVPETGVITQTVLEGIKELALRKRQLPILADSRRGLRDFPPVMFKMNAMELSALTGEKVMQLEEIKNCAAGLSDKTIAPCSSPWPSEESSEPPRTEVSSTFLLCRRAASLMWWGRVTLFRQTWYAR